jgi:hypothetical protein
MRTTPKEKTETLKCIKKILTGWVKSHATSEKGYLLLLKNREIKIPKLLKQRPVSVQF